MPPTRSRRTKPTAENPSESKSKSKDPKLSHLYTDDNPATTLHGTGFKDTQTAQNTIKLVSNRSLTYQWQVINTMYHRAKNHPAVKKAGTGPGAEGMKAAMATFKIWLDETCPLAKASRKEDGREYKPLLSKGIVKKYLDRIRSLQVDDSDENNGFKRFAETYVDLAKGKRLANVLVDDAKPEDEDWEIRREKALVELREEREGNGEDGLWRENGSASDWHLQCIAWAWSPVGERRLPP